MLLLESVSPAWSWPCAVSGQGGLSEPPAVKHLPGLLISLYFHLYSWAHLKFLLKVGRGWIHEEIKIM